MLFIPDKIYGLEPFLTPDILSCKNDYFLFFFENLADIFIESIDNKHILINLMINS